MRERISELLNAEMPTLGYCNGGAAIGAYIGFFPPRSLASEHDGEAAQTVWDARISTAVEDEGLFPGDTFLVDPMRGSDLEFLASLDISPVPSPAAEWGLFSLFPENFAYLPGTHDAGVTGRFSGAAPLARRLETLPRTGRVDNRYPADSDMTLRRVTRELDERFSLVDSLSSLLAAAGLSLAIVPDRGPLVLGDSEKPWTEFTVGRWVNERE
ncbi:hypothetical protein [Diaminobutyricimonas sp. LJ205]|uniref:hypothetical protein n=1 Tax=Diaminobutyricimonas sp. LJ205 TaxID=2683590 RepID=UPI0012F523AE|nr:hypothetical protein [Diaminobutyricimonas sp. LJ205]